MTTTASPAEGRRRSVAPRQPGAMLELARRFELEGRSEDAGDCYRAVIAETAGRPGQTAALAEALRRLAVATRGGDIAAARELCERSTAIAAAAGHALLAGEALNTLGALYLEAEDFPGARTVLAMAGASAAELPELRGRVELNLGIADAQEGNRGNAEIRFQLALTSFVAGHSERGCAQAYHNLGRLRSDEGRWAEAERCFTRALGSAETAGDSHTTALCLLNRAEALAALERPQAARLDAEEALVVLERLHSIREFSGAYRVLGTVLHALGSCGMAEQRLRLALELARQTGSRLDEEAAERALAALLRDAGPPHGTAG